MLYNGYSEASKWMYENPDEYKKVMNELYQSEEKESKKKVFKNNFSVKRLEIFLDRNYLDNSIEIPF